ncbi:hypothetical protein ES703_99005 [subsurface metagenome]
MMVEGEILTRSGMNSADIFRIADLCIEAGYFPGLEDGWYALRLVFEGDFGAVIHRRQVNCVLPRPCRIWLVKGRICRLLGDTASLPADLSAGVWPPFIG